MMTKGAAALALVVVLGATGATASDRYERLRAAYQAHFDCAFDAAMKLVDADGIPEALAQRAVRMCRAKESALGWYGRYATQTAATRLAGIIRSERKIPEMFRGKARSRPVAELMLFANPGACASAGCGMSPTIDPKTKIWRPYRH